MVSPRTFAIDVLVIADLSNHDGRELDGSNVDDEVEIEIEAAAADRRREIRDIPASDLIWCHGFVHGR